MAMYLIYKCDMLCLILLNISLYDALLLRFSLMKVLYDIINISNLIRYDWHADNSR